MQEKTKSGWLMSLRDDPESAWGSVEGFLEGLTDCPKRDGKYVMESQVWGRIGVKDLQPTRGHGIAFYHSTRARFPTRDPFNRKPRITLIGELLDIDIDGREVTRIEVAIDPKTLAFMKKHPIIRDGDMVEVFEQCGIRQGSVATFYFAEPRVWSRILKALG